MMKKSSADHKTTLRKLYDLGSRLETAAERYERLGALGKEGKLKDKRRRIV